MAKLKITSPITNYINKQVEKRVSAQLASMPETDTTIVVGTRTAQDIFKDRHNWDRQAILADALLQWRTNPIARKIIDTIVEFVIGDGLKFNVEHKATQKIVDEFWNHPLNNLDEQIPEWTAEQSRSGDLFLMCTVDPLSGNMFIRAFPSEQIEEIKTTANDYRQEKFYVQTNLLPNESAIPAYDHLKPDQTEFMLHFPINKPVGTLFGESDLTPVLRWLGRLNTLLNDRVILNHLRNLIVYVVKGNYTEKNSRKLREAELNAQPPRPGAIIVTDTSEEWTTLAANLQSYDAGADILAIKKHIAAGVGLPLHFLAEPESSTRTTANAAGTPTFRKFKRRQAKTKRYIEKLCKIAVQKRKHFTKTPRTRADAKILIIGDDVTERDNSLMALAAARIEPVLADLFDRDLIDEATYLYYFYFMMGEDYDQSGKQPTGKKRPLNAQPNKPAGAVSDDKKDAEDDPGALDK